MGLGFQWFKSNFPVASFMLYDLGLFKLYDLKCPYMPKDMHAILISDSQYVVQNMRHLT